jgi:hypothetical protein
MSQAKRPWHQLELGRLGGQEPARLHIFFSRLHILFLILMALK